MYLTKSETNLLTQLQGYPLTKKRYKYIYNDLAFGVDLFEMPFTRLVLAEIEFETENEMKSFVVPFADWKDVSLDRHFSGGCFVIYGYT